LSILQGSNLETQERHNNAMLTRRICKAPKKYSGKLQNGKQETIENIVKNTTTNNNDELIKRETLITEELSNLVPVIADLMSFVSNKVNYSDAKLSLLKRDYSVILIRVHHKHCKFTCSKMNQRRGQLIVKL